MAQKRMFDKNITCDDDFLELSAKAQALYFHIGMIADDDGLTKNYKLYMKVLDADENDLNSLVDKNFLYRFNSDIIVVKHWLINNTVRKDRYRETIYKDEYNQLEIAPNGEYIIKDNNGLPSGNQLATQYSIVKNSKEEKRIEECSVVENREEEILCPAIQDCIPYSEIINYLNQITGAHYKSSSQKTKTCIHARWQEGFRLDDFKIVINKKYNEWVGTNMEKFLRPETLFGTKFEGYLNQADIKREITTKDVEKIIDWEEYLND